MTSTESKKVMCALCLALFAATVFTMSSALTLHLLRSGHFLPSVAMSLASSGFAVLWFATTVALWESILDWFRWKKVYREMKESGKLQPHFKEAE